MPLPYAPPRRPNRPGFTLIETVVSSVVLAAMLLVFTTVFRASAASGSSDASRLAAATTEQVLRERFRPLAAAIAAEGDVSVATESALEFRARKAQSASLCAFDGPSGAVVLRTTRNDSLLVNVGDSVAVPLGARREVGAVVTAGGGALSAAAQACVGGDAVLRASVAGGVVLTDPPMIGAPVRISETRRYQWAAGSGTVALREQVNARAWRVLTTVGSGAFAYERINGTVVPTLATAADRQQTRAVSITLRPLVERERAVVTLDVRTIRWPVGLGAATGPISGPVSALGAVQPPVICSDPTATTFGQIGGCLRYGLTLAPTNPTSATVWVVADSAADAIDPASVQWTLSVGSGIQAASGSTGFTISADSIRGTLTGTVSGQVTASFRTLSGRSLVTNSMPSFTASAAAPTLPVLDAMCAGSMIASITGPPPPTTCRWYRLATFPFSGIVTMGTPWSPPAPPSPCPTGYTCNAPTTPTTPPMSTVEDP